MMSYPITKQDMENRIEQDRRIIGESLSSEAKDHFDQFFYPECAIQRSLKGSSNSIIVAPNGFPGDADQTDYIAYFLSRVLDAAYLINNKKYRKHGNEEWFGDIADFDNTTLQNQHTNMFIEKLLSAISVVRIKSATIPLVIFIDGFHFHHKTDHPIDICITDYSDQQDQMKSTLDHLLSNGCRISNGCSIAMQPGSLISYLKTNEKEIGLVHVIRIGIGFEKYREPNSVLSTATCLGQAIRYHPLFKTTNEDQSKKTHPIVSETKADLELVQRAGQKLTEIVSKHYESAMLEAGRYIIKEFYNQDYDLARNKKPTRDKSLAQLIQYLQSMGKGAPSKSWIYNAVNLAVDTYDNRYFSFYNHLMLSHKILLFPITDQTLKRELIKEIVKFNYTIQDLKLRLTEIKKINHIDNAEKSDQNQSTPLLPYKQPPQKTDKQEKKTSKSIYTRGSIPNRIIKAVYEPDVLLSDNFSSYRDNRTLKTFKKPVLKKIHQVVIQKIKTMEKEMAGLQAKIDKYKNHLVQYNQFVEQIQTIGQFETNS